MYSHTVFERTLHVDFTFMYKIYRSHQNVDLIILIGRDLFIVLYFSVAFPGTLYGMILKAVW